MNSLQAFSGNMRVDLSRRDIAMAEQHLDHTQIGSMIEEVRRKCVSQRVWRQGVRVDARGNGVAFDQVPERLPRHWRAASRKENKVASTWRM
jgi:hypothetical protein